MNTFNVKTLDYYFKNRDYTGAADYLSSIKANSPEAQDKLNEEIRELYRRGDIQNEMLQNMNDDDRQAFHFISAIDGSGIIPHKDKNNLSGNIYGDKYNNLLNNLQVNKDVIVNFSNGQKNINGESISKIRLEFSNGEYKKWLDNIGYNANNVDSLNISKIQDSKTGNYIIDIPITDTQITNYISAAISLTSDYGGAIGTGGGGYPFGLEQRYNVKGITTSNAVVNQDQFNIGNLYKANQLVNSARSRQQAAINNQQTITLDEDIVVTPFLGHGHANAYKRMQNGLINIDEYNKIVEERTDTYNRLLKQVGLSQYKVFTDTKEGKEKEGRIFKEIAAKDKDKVMQQILIAMDDKRLTYSAAMHNGEVGTYITITPATDKDKNIVKGDYGQGLRVFVPNLFKSSCDQTFNADTKQMAVRDNADMKRWNYGKFLKDGNYVGYDKNIGAYVLTKDEYGENIKTSIGEDKMLQLLNRENIINTSVSTLIKNMDDEGNPLTYEKNGKTYTYDIKDMAKKFSSVGTNELYPKESYSGGERLMQQNDMYNTIMYLLEKLYDKQNEE